MTPTLLHKLLDYLRNHRFDPEDIRRSRFFTFEEKLEILTAAGELTTVMLMKAAKKLNS